MGPSVPRQFAAALCSCLLLVAGAALVLVSLYLAAVAFGALTSTRDAQVALGLYYRVVVLKGLLPQLALALLVLPVLSRATARFPRPTGRGRLLLELAAAATVAYGVVAPLLLTVDFPHWPALQMNSLGNHLGSLLGMTAAVTACGWLPRALLPALRSAETADRPDAG